jgi:4-hydroxy-tetrahydrodipicolinate synthase
MFSGSHVALVTPMRPGGALDLDAWARLIDFHLAGGTSGVVVGGTTGESPTLSDAELRQLLVATLEQARGRLVVTAGAGLSSTAATVERARWLGELGVDALLVVTPAYNKPTQDGLFLHFTAVAAASRVPVMLYNVPGRTAVDMLPPTVARLSRVPGVVGLKEAVADPERVRELVGLCGPHFDVLSGDDATARDSVLAGARGVVSVTANVAPRRVADVIAAALVGDRDSAAKLDAPLTALHDSLFVEANPIPVKFALAEMGLIGPDLRLPLTPLSDRFHARLRAAMASAGLATRPAFPV